MASLPLPLPISSHTHARACHPSDQSPVGSAGPGCIMDTSIRPRSSIMHPLNSLFRPTRPLYQFHILCQLTNRRRMPMVQSLSLQSLLSPSRTTGSSSGIPEHVSLMSERQTYFMYSLPLPSPALGFYTFLHSSQSYRRWGVRNGGVFSLAWRLSPQYAPARHAVWPVRVPRACRQATSSRQEDEEAI